MLGPTDDGGWWTLGLADPGHAAVLHHVPTSTPDTHTSNAALTALQHIATDLTFAVDLH